MISDIEKKYNEYDDINDVGSGYYRSSIKKKENFSLFGINSWIKSCVTLNRVWIVSGILAILSFFFYFKILLLSPIGLFLFVSYIYKYNFKVDKEIPNDLLYIHRDDFNKLKSNVKLLESDVKQLPKSFVFCTLDELKKRIRNLEHNKIFVFNMLQDHQDKINKKLK